MYCNNENVSLKKNSSEAAQGEGKAKGHPGLNNLMYVQGYDLR